MRQSWALLLLFLPAYGQQPESVPETKIKVEVRRVPVDVIVTDAKGNPIGDLKKEDFTVLEDKKLQEITSFNLERTSSNVPAKKLPPVPDGFVSNAFLADPSASDLTVILFDELNTRFADAAYARSQMEKLLSHPSLKGHPVSLLLLNSELLTLHDFTDDPQQLLLAFKQHTPFLPILAEDEYSGFKVNPNNVPPSVAREALMGERQYQELFGRFNAVNRAEITLGAMRNLAESLRERPGRKRVLWFSAGFPIAFDEASLSRNSSMIPYQMAPDPGILRSVRETSLALTNARVAVYPVDVQGLISVSHLSSPARAMSTDRFNTYEDYGAMQTIAEQTGGQLIHGRNDLAASAVQLLDDGDEYYALTYRPTNTKQNGEFRKIEIKVNRPGMRARFRKGYFTPKQPKKDTPQPSPFYAAAVGPLQRNELQFAAAGVRTSDSSARFMIILSPDSLGTDAAGIVARRLDLVLVENAGPNKLFLGPRQHLELKIEQGNLKEFSTNGFPFVINLHTMGKANRVRLVLRDTATGQIGSLDLPLQKPTS